MSVCTKGLLSGSGISFYCNIKLQWHFQLLVNLHVQPECLQKVFLESRSICLVAKSCKVRMTLSATPMLSADDRLKVLNLKKNNKFNILVSYLDSV